MINKSQHITKAKRYRAQGCNEKDCHLLKIVLAGKRCFQNFPPRLASDVK